MKFLYRSFLLAFAAFFILGTAATAGAAVPIGTPDVMGVSCADTKDAAIEQLLEIDFYAIDLRAGEGLTIDIDSDGSLDSVLGVYDTDGITILAFEDDAMAPNEQVQPQAEPAAAVLPADSIPPADTLPNEDPPTNGNHDPYLDFVAPAEGTYFVAVASYGDNDFDGTLDDGLTPEDLTTGPYTIIFQCVDPPESLSGGELLGSTVGDKPEETGLFMINPENGIATLRFPFGSFDAVLEIEFRDDGVLFGATGDGSSNIITIDPDTGIKTVVGAHQAGEVNALEFVGNILYGAYVEYVVSEGIVTKLDSKLVTVDQTTGSLSIVGAVPIVPGGVVEGLAFNSETGVMYGATVSATATGFVNELITIDLNSGVGTSVGSMALGVEKITALEFSLDGLTLYGATDRGVLLKIDPASGAVTVVEGTAALSADAVAPINLPAVTGLTFVPTKDSTNEISLASELGNNLMVKRALDKFNFKKELPDIDIFKFEGMPGETVTVTLAQPDAAADAEGEASLVVQDVMRDLHLREKVKGLLPLTTTVTLPDAEGKYLIIVRNLMYNPYKGCYRLTVKSGGDGLKTGVAHKTLEETWSVEPSGCTDGAAMVAVDTAEEEPSDPPANDGPAGLTSVGESDRAAFSGDSTLEVSIQVSTEQPAGEEPEASDTGDNVGPATGDGSVETLAVNSDPVISGAPEPTTVGGDTVPTDGGDTEMATEEVNDEPVSSDDGDPAVGGGEETEPTVSGDAEQDVVDGTEQPTDGMSEPPVDDPVVQTPSEETVAAPTL